MDIEHLAKNLFYAYEDGNRLQPLWEEQLEYYKVKWMKVAEFVLQQEEYIKRVRLSKMTVPFVSEAI